MTPADVAAIDPLGIGPSRAAAQYFAQYPSPNEPGSRPNNIDGFRFAAPIENEFYTLISRVDYNLSETGNHKVFGRFGKQDDTINDPPQFPGQDPRRSRLFNNYRPRARLRLGADVAPDQQLPVRADAHRRGQRRRRPTPTM